MIGDCENNWVTIDTPKQHHKRAIELAEKRKKYEDGRKFVRLPHPSGIKNTWILKEIK